MIFGDRSSARGFGRGFEHNCGRWRNRRAEPECASVLSGASQSQRQRTCPYILGHVENVVAGD